MATRRRSVNTIARRALRFEGMDELKEQLGKLASEMSGKAIKDGLMTRVAIPLRDAARAKVAVKTGNLRRGIFAGRGDEGKPDVLVGVNYRIAPHAHLVEFGHAGPHPAPPHPFMRPAVQENKDRARKGIEDTYSDVIKKYAK